jgi:hypothetical protein
MMHPGGFHQMVTAHHEGYLHDAMARHYRDEGNDDRHRAPRPAWLDWLQARLRQVRRATA